MNAMLLRTIVLLIFPFFINLLSDQGGPFPNLFYQKPDYQRNGFKLLNRKKFNKIIFEIPSLESITIDDPELLNCFKSLFLRSYDSFLPCVKDFQCGFVIHLNNDNEAVSRFDISYSNNCEPFFYYRSLPEMEKTIVYPAFVCPNEMRKLIKDLFIRIDLKPKDCKFNKKINNKKFLNE